MYVMKNNKRKDIIMLAFACDYMEGAHEKILQRLSETNYERRRAMETIFIVRAQRKRSAGPANVRRRIFTFLREGLRQMRW